MRILPVPTHTFKSSGGIPRMMASAQGASPSARYGVVVCPQCRHARGLELKTRTSTCGRCGKRSDNRRLQVLYEAQDAEELRTAVGVVEARVTGGEAALVNLEELAEEVQRRAQARTANTPRTEPRDEEGLVQWAASRAAGEQGTQGRIRRIIAALEEGQNDGFTEKQLEAAFEAAGLPPERANNEIRSGLVRDELYEPRPGRLKRL